MADDEKKKAPAKKEEDDDYYDDSGEDEESKKEPEVRHTRTPSLNSAVFTRNLRTSIVERGRNLSSELRNVKMMAEKRRNELVRGVLGKYVKDGADATTLTESEIKLVLDHLAIPISSLTVKAFLKDKEAFSVEELVSFLGSIDLKSLQKLWINQAIPTKPADLSLGLQLEAVRSLQENRITHIFCSAYEKIELDRTERGLSGLSAADVMSLIVELGWSSEDI